MLIRLKGFAGVDDLKEQNCKLGVYNAERGERGILSLQVYFAHTKLPAEPLVTAPKLVCTILQRCLHPIIIVQVGVGLMVNVLQFHLGLTSTVSMTHAVYYCTSGSHGNVHCTSGVLIPP